MKEQKAIGCLQESVVKTQRQLDKKFAKEDNLLG